MLGGSGWRMPYVYVQEELVGKGWEAGAETDGAKESK